jgi:HEAT repeat protein
VPEGVSRGRVSGPAATAEEAERAITRLLAEWEWRARRLRLEGSGALLSWKSNAINPMGVAARERVIQQLAALGPEAMEPLISALRLEAPGNLATGRAAMAALALGRMGDFSAAPPLLAALRDQRPDGPLVRGAAALALGELKAEAAAAMYERALSRQSSDDWQREIALLSALRVETVVLALVEALRDPAPEVRAAATDACIDLCLAEPPEALLFAGKLKPPAPTDEAPAFGPEAGAVAVSDATPSPLVLAVEPLSEALKDANAAVRASAANALGWIGDTRAVAALARCLKDPDEACRVASAQALGMLRSPLALKPLARALGDASLAVRRQVAESLGRLGDPITADLLSDALTDEEEALEVRAAAARALGVLHLPQALPVLQELLDAPEPALRLATVEALGSLGFGRVYRILAPLLWRDPDRAVRHAAARAVARLSGGRQQRARWRLRLALRVAPQTRQEALAILEEHARAGPQALRE